MFRAIIIALSGAAALSAAAAQAGGSCGVKSGGHGHVQYRQPYYAQKVYVKPVHVEPIYIERVPYCYYKVFYKQPCWDYQKQLSFNDIHEAKQMAQMFYDNGFKVALLKYDGFTYDKTGYGKTGGPIGGGPVGGGPIGNELIGGKPLPSGQVQSQILFQGDGKILTNQGPPPGNLAVETPLLDQPQSLAKPQTLDLPLVLNGAE